MVSIRLLCMLSMTRLALAQADYTPGQGCCAVRHADTAGLDLTFTISAALNKDTNDDIPEGSQCDPEWTGFEARLFEGNWIQDMDISCLVPDAGFVRVRSLNLLFTNGTSVDAGIRYYANGTVETKCTLSTASYPPDEPKFCVGPAQGHRYVGPFTYGSAPVERYAQHMNGFVNMFDFDVKNGCIPVAVIVGPHDGVESSALRINNWKLEAHQVLPDGTFNIPPECFQAQQDQPSLRTPVALPSWAWKTRVALV